MAGCAVRGCGPPISSREVADCAAERESGPAPASASAETINQEIPDIINLPMLLERSARRAVRFGGRSILA
jgi:hypothetical protein